MINKILFILVVFILLIGVGQTSAKTQFSGFFSTQVLYQNKNTLLNLGLFELAIEENLDRFNFAGALDVEDGEVSLGATYGEFNINNIVNVQFGLLDLPFGIDYQYYATPDRKFVSEPLTTTYILDGGWTLVALNLTGKVWKNLKYNLFFANNFENTKFRNLGVNLTIPISFFELSFSYLDNESFFKEEKSPFYNVGTKIKFFNLEIEGEYFYNRDLEGNSFYTQLLSNFAAFYSGVRFDNVDKINSLSGVLGYYYNENVFIKTEYKKVLSNKQNIWQSEVVYIF